MNELIEKIKREIIEELSLEDITPADIDENQPLFVEGLGLDSIDSLELLVWLRKKYDLKVPSADEGRVIFKSVRSIAEFITANGKG